MTAFRLQRRDRTGLAPVSLLCLPIKKWQTTQNVYQYNMPETECQKLMDSQVLYMYESSDFNENYKRKFIHGNREEYVL